MEKDVFEFLNGLSKDEVVNTSSSIVSYDLSSDEEILKILNGLNEYDARNQIETNTTYTYDDYVIKLYNKWKFFEELI